MEGYCYRYDGTFAGFLCCVDAIYRYREPPALFLLPGDFRPTLYEDRWIDAREDLARRIYRRLEVRLGRKGAKLVLEGFLTALDHRERWLCDFIDLGLKTGPGVERRLCDEPVLRLQGAVRRLQRECDHLIGFVRFTDCQGLLVAQIHPKNQVLPILRRHFCDRLAEEPFLLYDATHHQALLHRPGAWAIVPVTDFTPPAPDAQEAAWQAMWRRFYDTLAIPQRYDPKGRQSHMPRRFWQDMTELQDPPGPPELPGRAL